MFKLSDKRKKLMLVMFAIASVIITCVVSSISNSADISKEVLAKLDEKERQSSISSQMGTVIIKYVDVQGNELAPSESITGNVGTEYKAKRKSIATYAPHGTEPYNKAGNYEKNDQEVVFVYEKEDSSVEVSEQNNTVTVRTLHERNAKELDVKIITKDEKGNLIKGVSYKVTDSKNTILRDGKVQGDTFVAGTLTIADDGSDTYTIEENTNSYYDKLEENPIKFTVRKEWDNKAREYVAYLEYGDYNGVAFELTENEIIINITNKESDNSNIFDLNVEKYVKKVVVKENDKAIKEYKASEEEKGNLIKIDIAKKKLSNTKIEVTYGLKVTNVGNVTGSALEIVDYLPDGFKYISGGNWIIEGNNIKTNDLSDVELNAGDSIEIEVLTECNLDDNQLGLRDNKVEITDYYNDLDIDDKTPDNTDTASVMTTIKTGGAEVPVGTILLILNVLLIGTYMVKKARKEKSRDEK